MPCIIVAAAGTAMHPGAVGCIECITGGPGGRRAAGAAVTNGTAGLRFNWSRRALDLATGPLSLHRMHPCASETDVHAAAGPPVGFTARRRAAVPRTCLGMDRGGWPADARDQGDWDPLQG